MLYKLIVNWHGQQLEEWGRYPTPHQAWYMLCARMSVKLDTTANAVRLYCNGRRDVFKLEQVEEVVDGKNKKVKYIDVTAKAL